MKNSTLLGLWLLGVVLAAAWQGTFAGCVVPMTDGRPNPAPLILVRGHPPKPLKLKLPSLSGYLNFASEETVHLACPGPNNFFDIFPSVKYVTVTCVRNVTFKHNENNVAFSSFSCSKVPQAKTRKSGNCNNETKHTGYEVGFVVNAAGDFFQVAEGCFDEEGKSALWYKSHILPAVNYILPKNIQDLKHKKLNEQNLQENVTNKTNYNINFNFPLKMVSLSDPYIFNHKSQELDRTNFVPQWSKFNVNLWDVAGRRIRSYTERTGEGLVVYTGTQGVVTMPDKKANAEGNISVSDNGDPSSIRNVPVPALLWKVVYNPNITSAVVLVFNNNPYKTKAELESDLSYKLCITKRYLSRWYVCASSSEEIGLGYCCAFDDFRNFVNSVPQLNVTDILS